MTKPRPFGHYFILEKIAQGGMAEIFKGLTYDFAGIKKLIVIKRILPRIAANPEFIKMLVAEAKIAVNLSHGNIAQIYDLGKVASDYFIVMEYVDGKSLSQIQKKCFEKGVLMPSDYVAYVISELCNGLDYMHRKKDEMGNDLKIVHRDISPQNIIVSYSGNVKIVDFGVAKATFKLAEKEVGVLKGKFAYMSPEQAEGKIIDSRSDIFSAGVVLWELLTGQRLFKKKSNLDTVEAVKKMTALPPSQFRPEIPSELDAIVLRALQKDSEKRYASAHDIALDLTKYLLKHHPDFKALSLGDYLAHLFERDEEVTGDIHEERTLKGDVQGEVEEISRKIPEDTQRVNPEEIDFHSIFEEISWGDGLNEGVPKEEFQEISISIPLLSNFDDLSVTPLLPSPEKKRGINQVLWIILFMGLAFLIGFIFLKKGG